MVSDAIKTLEAELGRDVTDIEVAEKLDISLNEYHHILNEVSTGKIIGIEDLGVSEDAIQYDEDKLSIRHDPYQSIEQVVFKKALTECISTLPEREALVLSLYYDEELKFKVKLVKF